VKLLTFKLTHSSLLNCLFKFPLNSIYFQQIGGGNIPYAFVWVDYVPLTITTINLNGPNLVDEDIYLTENEDQYFNIITESNPSNAVGIRVDVLSVLTVSGPCDGKSRDSDPKDGQPPPCECSNTLPAVVTFSLCGLLPYRLWTFWSC